MLRSMSPGRFDRPIRKTLSLTGHRQAGERRAAHRLLVLELQQADVAHDAARIAGRGREVELDDVRGRQRRVGVAPQRQGAAPGRRRDLDVGAHRHLERLALARVEGVDRHTARPAEAFGLCGSAGSPRRGWRAAPPARRRAAATGGRRNARRRRPAPAQAARSTRSVRLRRLVARLRRRPAPPAPARPAGRAAATRRRRSAPRPRRHAPQPAPSCGRAPHPPWRAAPCRCAGARAAAARSSSSVPRGTRPRAEAGRPAARRAFVPAARAARRRAAPPPRHSSEASPSAYSASMRSMASSRASRSRVISASGSGGSSDSQLGHEGRRGRARRRRAACRASCPTGRPGPARSEGNSRPCCRFRGLSRPRSVNPRTGFARGSYRRAPAKWRAGRPARRSAPRCGARI